MLAGDRADVSHGQIKNRLSAQRLRGDFRPRPRSDGRAGSKDLDATAFSASAYRASVVNAYVTALSRRSRLSVIDGAIEDDAGSDPGPNRHVEDVTETSSRSPKSLRQRRSVRVIVDFHRHAVFVTH